MNTNLGFTGVIVLTLLSGGCATSRNVPTAATPVASEAPAVTRSYSADEIARTGKISAADALQLLEPAITRR
jgi:hypothetical protein